MSSSPGKPPRSTTGPLGSIIRKAQNNFQQVLHSRQASLTPAEEFFLHALLIDPPVPAKKEEAVVEADKKTEDTLEDLNHDEDHQHVKTLERATRILQDDMLFSVPPSVALEDQKLSAENIAALEIPPPAETTTSGTVPKKPKRPSIVGLWKAYQDGVTPQQLRASSVKSEALSESKVDLLRQLDKEISSRDLLQEELTRTVSSDQQLLESKVKPGGEELRKTGIFESDATAIAVGELSSEEDIASDEEVRSTDEFIADDSSWEEEDLNFNAWDVLKHDYAEEFGFDYKEKTKNANSDSEDGNHTFMILGTSADDVSSQPHVLSPPLMDALVNFLPDALQGQNWWLKFSLVRDGASMDTLKRYIRASPNTLLAIETDKGQVFGCFTSSAWHHHPSVFGTAPCFVWKLRHGRRSARTSSLFEQAQMESLIDVFLFTGFSSFVQVCRHDCLAIGGKATNVSMDNIEVGAGDSQRQSMDLDDVFPATTTEDTSDRDGFAICLEQDLLRGSSSPSATFKNPTLCSHGEKTELFYVAGLEAWTLTPQRSVPEAEKLEMTKFFMESSLKNSSSMDGSSGHSALLFSSDTLSRDKFYKRVGHDMAAQERRELWQYRNMMDGDVGSGGNARGFGASPRFGR